MKRVPWDILLAFLVGLGVGLVYAWSISPLRVVNADPGALRTDFKDNYRSAIAAAYAANGNLPRAQARLSLLRDPDSIDALNAQAQRMRGSSDAFQQADQVAALALELHQNADRSPTSIPATAIVDKVEVISTGTPLPSPSNAPIILTETQLPVETQPTLIDSTPRATATPAPTLGAPFALIGQENLCDTNLPNGLLQVIVLNSNRRQMPGMKIMITWGESEDQFFTGLKPELGNGYADYIMTPTIAYTIQLAAGSDAAAGLTTPTCQTPGDESFVGGIKLTFQQP